MKSSSFLLVLLLMVIHSSCLLGQCYNLEQLYVTDPDHGGITKQAAIEDVMMEVRPAGKFYEVDLYMTYRVNPKWIYIQNTIHLRLCIFQAAKAMFPLLIHGCGLRYRSWRLIFWKGVQLFNIYEGIVNRRKDPVYSTKNQEDAYEFRIFLFLGQKAGRSNLLSHCLLDENEAFELPFGHVFFELSKTWCKGDCLQKDSLWNPILAMVSTLKHTLPVRKMNMLKQYIPATKYSAAGGSINTIFV